ncbi:hypothetical protein L484_026723 [Morus notabilis]|uniref:Uncharacterized protein n=1 Tax=Morus notabilis TaxID=981085 RepID=W9SCU9_9ROSA|nr:hypothetical protein L484_026723 [Morus notabilis]
MKRSFVSFFRSTVPLLGAGTSASISCFSYRTALRLRKSSGQLLWLRKDVLLRPAIMMSNPTKICILVPLTGMLIRKKLGNQERSSSAVIWTIGDFVSLICKKDKL